MPGGLGPETTAEALQRIGLVAFGRYMSPYRGRVTRVDDPQQRGRIQARVPRTGPETTDANFGAPDVWIDPMTGLTQDKGNFWPPELGDYVWVYFDEGLTSSPLAYLGGWSPTDGMPAEFAYTLSGDNVVAPERRGWVTRTGHALLFDDSSTPSVQLVWRKPASGDPAVADRSKTASRSEVGPRRSTLGLLADGSVELTAADGAKVTLSEAGIRVELPNKSLILLKKDGSLELATQGAMTLSGKSLTLDFPDITLGKGGTSRLLKANEFEPQYMTHTHGTAVGPTSPPLVPLTGVQRTVTVKGK